MRTNTFFPYLLFAAITLTSFCLTACSDDDDEIISKTELEETYSDSTDDDDDDSSDSDDEETATVTEETYYVTYFANYVMSIYYYWLDEISDKIDEVLNPNTCTDPISAVEEIRYSDSTTGIVDSWTQLTDDYDSFTSSVDGVETTYGLLCMRGAFSNSDSYFYIVCAVYKDSPAEEAGIKRGDFIIGLNGEEITSSNYYDLYDSSSITLNMATLSGNTLSANGTSYTLTAISMYEDPVLYYTIYDVGSKKVGYIVYDSFDLTSVSTLIEISKEFKAEGVTELILDLRYNGGGYVLTEQVMASMYAPEANVKAKDVLEMEIYNSYLTEVYDSYYNSSDWNKTYFQTSWNYTTSNSGIDFQHDTSDANIGLDKVYGLVTGNSASASEALLTVLMPYMDVELVGETSYGKYCSGYIMEPSDVFSRYPSVLDNWGIYVMVSIYQNANGETPCMPNGMEPDIYAEEDLPFVDWGDESDPLLRAALESAGKTYSTSSAAKRTYPEVSFKRDDLRRRATSGKRILPPVQVPEMSELSVTQE